MSRSDCDISVIVCTYDRSTVLDGCLDSMSTQTLARERFEVIVVDNNSTDDTAAVVDRHAESAGNIRHVLEPRQGLSFARNRGIDEAHGEIVTFFDDDTVVAPGCLAAIVDAFERHPNVLCMGGRIRVEKTDVVPKWMHTSYMDFVATNLDLGSWERPFGKREHPRGANISFRREVFERFGRFDTSLGRTGNNLVANEEQRLLRPLRQIDGACLYVPDAEVLHLAHPARIGRGYVLARIYAKGISDVRADSPVDERPWFGSHWLAFKVLYVNVREGIFHQMMACAYGAGVVRERLARAWRRIRRSRSTMRARLRPFVHRVRARLGLMPREIAVQLQTQSACNGKCVFCPYVGSWAESHPGTMDDALFDKIVTDLRAYTITKMCMYLENEPLLDKKLVERVTRICDELDFGVLEIATNASALTPERADALANVLAGTPHQIWVSFHGCSKESDEKTMGLDFDRSLSHVVHLLQLADAWDLTVMIRGAGVARKEHANKAPEHFSEAEFIAFWDEVLEENGIRKRPILRYVQYHDRAGNVNEEYALNVHRDSLKGFYCFRTDAWLHVMYNGDVILCCNDYHLETVLGNLGEQTIREVVKSKRYRETLYKALGMLPSSDDFLCKRCSKPGG